MAEFNRSTVNRGNKRSTPEDYLEEFPVGRKIEHWTITGPAFRDGRRWKIPCQCDCEKRTKKAVQVNALRPLASRGGRVASKSCGCHNLEVRRNRLPVGHKCGRLTVVRWVRQAVRPNGRPSDSIYLCKCDCVDGGTNYIEIQSRHIHSPKGSRLQESCGCFKRQQSSIATSKRIREGKHANATHAYCKDGELIHRMRSSWELAVAYDYLDSKEIKFEYEPESFVTPFGAYTPDFYLPETDEWIEVKGLWRPNAKAKFEWFAHFHSTILINKENLKSYTGLTDHEARKKYRGHSLYAMGFTEFPTCQDRRTIRNRDLVQEFCKRFPPITGNFSEDRTGRHVGVGDFLYRWTGISRTQQQRYRAGEFDECGG